jgi:hypothetical protein
MHDTKCHELAKSFLSDSEYPSINTEENVNQLAEDIQRTIEDFLSEKEDNCGRTSTN